MSDVNGSGNENDFGRWANPNCRQGTVPAPEVEWRSPLGDDSLGKSAGEALGVALAAHLVVFAGVILIVAILKVVA